MYTHLNPIYLLMPAVTATVIVGLALYKKFWLWPTHKLLFPTEDLDPAFLIDADVPSCDKAMIPIKAGNFSSLLLAQITIYLFSILWANLLAGIILSTAPSLSLLHSGRLDLQIYDHVICVLVTTLTSLFAFYKLQNIFFQRIASGKLPRNVYIDHLHFACLIFIASLFWILPPVQCFILQPLIILTKPQFSMFIVFWQFFSFAPLLFALLILTGDLFPYQNVFEDLFLHQRVVKMLDEGDCSIDGLRLHTDSDLLLMARAADLQEDFETSRLIEVILNERYEAKHVV